MRKSNNRPTVDINFALLLIFLFIGVFLRVYKISTNYYFSGELGKELLYMRELMLNHTFPLIGLPTSHEWLNYGPIYYWIMLPVFKLFNGNPYILFWTAFTVSIVGLILNFAVVKKIADQKIALISTAVMTISPLFIWQTRNSKLHVFFWIIMPLLTYLLYLLWNGKKRWTLTAGLLFGILFSFHFSQIPMLWVFVFLFWIKRDIYKFTDWIKFGVGVLIPNITLLWKDRAILLWLPYRVADITQKNPAATLSSLNEYFGKNIFWDQRLWLIGFIIFLVIFANYISKNSQKLFKDFLSFYIISSISLMLLANIIHGSPPVHYFLPIFTVVPLLYAIYLNKLKFWVIPLILILLLNLLAFNNDPFFYKSFSGVVKGSDFVGFSAQNAAAGFIVTNSKGQPVSVRRIGAFDYFPETYSQNYQYLILYKGGNLIKTGGNTYTVNESGGSVNVSK